MNPEPPAPAKRKLPWRLLIGGAAGLAVLALLYSKIDVEAVHARTQELDSWVLFLLLVVLPLFGFPVSVLHVVAGIRWGATLGLELVIASILLQLLASYALVLLFRPLFARRLEGVQRRIPRGAHGPVCLFTMLLPGVPYFAKNYVLPLIGVPLPTFLLWCFPLHALRSSVAVIFGDASDALTPQRIAAFALYAVCIALACAWAFRRMREHTYSSTSGA